MAIYHLHIKNISRAGGRSAVAAAAYRAGETLPNDAEERLSAFAGRRDVLHSEIVAPPDAPPWARMRSELWNRVEAAESRKDARLAKEIEFALPRELQFSVWVGLARQMTAYVVGMGAVADFAIHSDPGNRNPHVHMLIATRWISAKGFGVKNRQLDGLAFVTGIRKLWAELANAALGVAGANITIEASSHAARGLEAKPGIHRGPDMLERRSKYARMEAAMILPEAALSLGSTDEVPDPVPDPDGNPITPAQLATAEEAMLAEMHRDARPPASVVEDREARTRALETTAAQNAAEVTDIEAAAYRLDPDGREWWRTGTGEGGGISVPSEPAERWWERYR